MHDVDEQGRAIVNSSPLHWPLILAWLSFGATPTNPSSKFISECKYWKLDRLLHAMEVKQDFDDAPSDVQVMHADSESDLTVSRVEKGYAEVAFLLKGRIY